MNHNYINMSDSKHLIHKRKKNPQNVPGGQDKFKLKN